MTDKEFCQQLEKHRHEFYAFSKKTVWNGSQAEDCFSSAVLTAYEKRNEFIEGTNFKAWMYKILLNKCYNANKKKQNNVISLEPLLEKEVDFTANPSVSSDELTAGGIEGCGDEVMKAFTTLNEKEKACLLLKSFEDYSYKEIAKVVEIPIGTVMTHLYRAREKMKKLLLAYAQREGIVKTDDKNSSAQDRWSANET